MDPLGFLRDGNDPDPGPTSLDEQTLYELLANPRRRHIIEHVAERDEPTTKRQLAELLAALEDDEIDLNDITHADQQSAYVSLHQQHIPALQEHGLVEEIGDDEFLPTDRCRQVAGIILAVRRLNGGGVDG